MIRPQLRIFQVRAFDCSSNIIILCVPLALHLSSLDSSVSPFCSPPVLWLHSRLTFRSIHSPQMKALEPFCSDVDWAMQRENLSVAGIVLGETLVPGIRSRCCYSYRCTLVDVLLSIHSYRYTLIDISRPLALLLSRSGPLCLAIHTG